MRDPFIAALFWKEVEEEVIASVGAQSNEPMSVQRQTMMFQILQWGFHEFLKFVVAYARIHKLHYMNT